jgi:hypothetical protein
MFKALFHFFILIALVGGGYYLYLERSGDAQALAEWRTRLDLLLVRGEEWMFEREEELRRTQEEFDSFRRRYGL